ncbi:MAG: FAD-dependent oxidoreductase [Acidobacteria bacterium]|nr:FAD-dependent oxidoreductase [Acidobacteriota bacterium]
MPDVIVLGGGLAGLAAAAALGSTGASVELFESKPFLGGRATSYALPDSEVIDNCQHILLRCCVNLLDFYHRLGVDGNVKFFSEIPFMEPGGRVSIFRRGILPAPLHFTESFLRLPFLSLLDKIAIGRAFLAILLEHKNRKDLDDISMLDWLQEKRQTPNAIERFWRQVLVSAVNEELDRMAASHGFQVFRLGFLATNDSYEMGVPNVPLGDLYGSEAWSRIPAVKLRLRSAVEKVEVAESRVSGVISGGERFEAEQYVSAVSFERVANLIPDAGIDTSVFNHSSITGVHLWFDRPVTELDNATLLDRNIQWFFNKDGGRYLQLVISASRSLLEMPRQQVIDLALKELREFLPAARDAQLVKAHVVKEARATFSASPGLHQHRPESKTRLANLWLAGDWTNSGWPATMEGAVRSGYKAAEFTAAALGHSAHFLLPDIK